MSIVYTAPQAPAQKGGAYPLYATPATLGLTPNAFDVEFDSQTLPSNMEIWDATAGAARTVAGPPVWRGTLSGSNPYIDAHNPANGGRASWMRVQLPTTNNIFIGFPLLSVPGVNTTWATRISYPNNASLANGYVRFGLCAAVSGHMDPANRAMCGLSNNQANLYTEYLLAGVGQAGTGTGDSIQRANSPPEYFWLERNVGTSPATYTLCAASADGTAFVCQQTYQPTFTPAYVALSMRVGGMGAGTANNVFMCDFIRQLAGQPIF